MGTFDFEVRHIPGVDNVVPDVLSRASDELKKLGVEELMKLQKEVVESADRREQIMMDYHTLGHFSAKELAKRVLQAGYWWSTLVKDCENMVQSCSECRRVDVVRHGYHPLTTIHASLPWENIAIDLLTLPASRNGMRYLLVAVDRFTKFILLAPLPDKTMVSVSMKLWEWITIFGPPKIIQSDNGAEFVNNVIAKLIETYQIDHRTISAYNPKANGLAERQMRTILSCLRKMLHGDPGSWDLRIPFVQLSMNLRIARITGSAPFALMFNRQCAGFLDYVDAQNDPIKLEEWENQHQKLIDVVYPAIEERALVQEAQMKAYFDKRHWMLNDEAFPPGCLVMVLDKTRSNKLQARYEGPFVVIKRNKGGAYVLKDLEGALLPRNYPGNHLKIAQQLPFDIDEIHEVEKVLDHRPMNGKNYYLVKWKNVAAQTWEPEENFMDQNALANYWTRREADNQLSRGYVGSGTKPDSAQEKSKPLTIKIPVKQVQKSNHYRTETSAS